MNPEQLKFQLPYEICVSSRIFEFLILSLIISIFYFAGESPTDGLEELSKTPTNKNSSNDSITETSQNSTETFQQRKEEAKSRRRKKKKTNSSVVASTFQDLYHMTGEILGQGAYASVRTCRNIWTDQEFAVKIIDKVPGHSRARVFKEIDTFYHCRGHKNIIQLIEYFEEPDRFYLVFEKINGGKTLYSY